MNGISNSANDSAVKSDLSNFAKGVQMIHAEEGVYPSGGATIAVENGPVVNGRATIAPSRGLTFSVSKSAYFRPTQSGAADFMYCVGPEDFAVLARSASGVAFRHSSANGLEELGSQSVMIVRCGAVTGYPLTVSYGYFTNDGGWQPWVQ